MSPHSAVIYLALAALCCSASAAKPIAVKFVKAPPTAGGNTLYAGNRAPLLPSPLIKLPTGSVRPEGWLRVQMELMADGFIGHLPEISEYCKFKGNAWVSPDGEGDHGWEEVSYWLKGYTALGYNLQDKRIIAEAGKWLDGIMANQRANGYFGSQQNLASHDSWPNMPVLHAVRTYYEATGDKRALSFLTRYFRWQMSLPLNELVSDVWGRVRGGDNLDSVYWLYNQTGEKWLLDLARTIHERTADWTGGVASWHGVNFAQGYREPAEYYQQTKDPRYLRSAIRNYGTVIGIYGQVPGGLFGADENCRDGYIGPRQGTETCTMVEFMYSHEMMGAITGDPVWLDRCEDVAFNSLPASMTPDLKGLHYFTAPNQVQLDAANKAPMIQNGGEQFNYNPYEYRCCQHNVGFGWPYFSEHLWMATAKNGLAAVMYSACEVTAKVGNGVKVRIKEITDYPFDETASLSISASKPVSFPLYLRIPGWCDHPGIAVNGKALPITGAARGWAVIERTWKTGDQVTLRLPMQVKLRYWEKNKDSVSVYRGPLAYSLKIGERWERFCGTDKWPGYQVFPATPWNYGLVLDRKGSAPDFEVIKNTMPINQPFTPDNAPVELKARARRIPEWTLETNGMIGEVQQSPAKSDAPTDSITLIPMGCARLRVSAFPWIGNGPNAVAWEDSTVTASASQVSNSLKALDDGADIESSADPSVSRFTWWDHLGSEEWVQYAYSKPRTISFCEVYWYDDTRRHGQCKVPASWQVLWWDGKAWKQVEKPSGYATEEDCFNRASFEPVKTTMIRLQVKLQGGFSGGILEWKAGTD